MRFSSKSYPLQVPCHLGAEAAHVLAQAVQVGDTLLLLQELT